MPREPDWSPPKFACDAMCGGLARWLRVLGYDTTYTPGIEDGALVAHAQAEDRVVVSSDTRLFQRRLFLTGELCGFRLPVGLTLLEQVRCVFGQLKLTRGFPRCTVCNGVLERVSRADVADVVPARSLVWVTTFYRCATCAHVYWEGTHWQRIRAACERLETSDAPLEALPEIDRPTGEHL